MRTQERKPTGDSTYRLGLAVVLGFATFLIFFVGMPLLSTNVECPGIAHGFGGIAIVGGATVAVWGIRKKPEEAE